MRIANYLRPECVALHQRADSLEGAVQQLVALLDGTEDLTDTAAFAADVRARLALGGVCVGNGLAIPHAKSASVKRLQLAALTLDPPLACDTPDGGCMDCLVNLLGTSFDEVRAFQDRYRILHPPAREYDPGDLLPRGGRARGAG